MSRPRIVLGALGVLGAAAGAAFAAERIVVKRMRARSADDDELIIRPERTHRLSAHDGAEIFVVESGPTTGPVLLLSHGVTLSVRTWARQLADLGARGFRVVAFDHRGHGDSTLGADGHGIEQLAADLRSILEGLDLADVVIVGHSMGGIATQSFCLHHPDVARGRVAGIVLLSTLARSPFAANPRLGRLIDEVATRLPDSAGMLKPRDLGLVIARFGFGRKPRAADVEATREMILATSATTRRDAVLALAPLDFTDRLHEIDRPTLVIGGTADLIAPVAESRRIARRVPGARLVEVAGGGHMLMLERTELVDDLIADFAASVQVGAASVRASAGAD